MIFRSLSMSGPVSFRKLSQCWAGMLWAAVLGAVAPVAMGDVNLVPAGAVWRYLDNGSDQGTAWRSTGFNDSAWKTGAAELGYGDGDEATVVSFGPSSSSKYITTWFRHSFEVQEPELYESLLLKLVRDDGAVVYLNGVELGRSNMPSGNISHTTLASGAVADGADESFFHQWNLPAAGLVAGINCLAVEVHQANATSSDLGFNLSLVGVAPEPVVAVVAAGAVWKYWDKGVEPGASWVEAGFNDNLWAAGAAELGYGDGGENTVIGYGSSSTQKYITTWFRHRFEVADHTLYPALKLRLMRDDGAAVYLNGVEINRSNLPAGTLTATTVAPTAVAGAEESQFFESIVPNGLVTGTNILAVEVHQQSGTSSDVSFDLELLGFTEPPAVNITRGPYLQSGTPQSMVIRWRTDVPTDSVVFFGTASGVLDGSVVDATLTTEHEVAVQGLLPDTQYFYSVGSSMGTLAAGPDYLFRTSIPTGAQKPFRVWVLGDSGTANSNAAAVRDAYLGFNNGSYTPLWLMLGDNAYNNGTDAEFQAAVFDMYPEMLRQSPLWSTLGNHEYYTAQGAPYFDSHTFPVNGEAGGQPSGTEKYYSFDYGNVHFICLDSMSSDRSVNGPMAAWLQADLESTVQDWIIAFWHHPPYTFGSHNSDNVNGSDGELVQMRANFLPLLEAGGVDLVLGGHSHSYERSYLLNGHYGYSGTFSESMKMAPGNGFEDAAGLGAYSKPAGLPANQGAVYAVAGSSGKKTNWWGGSTALVNPNPHPAMVVSLLELGSMVLDFNAGRLDVRFLNSTGQVRDQFTLKKDVPTVPPVAEVTSPAANAVVNLPVLITATATPDSESGAGSITRVDFYDGETLIGSSAAPVPPTTSTFSLNWTQASPGVHTLTAEAWDDLGAYGVSAPVEVTVNAPPSVLIASPADGATFDAPATIGIAASATDPDGDQTVVEVSFYQNGSVLLGTDTSAPWELTWADVPVGDYTLTAVARDSTGAEATSAPVTVRVLLPNSAPSVELMQPLAGGNYVAPATIPLEAVASDADGNIVRVDFMAGGAVVGQGVWSADSNSWVASWAAASDGNFSVTAVAHDDRGATSQSAAVAITVLPPPNQPPVVSLTGPVDASVYKTNSLITLAAGATDPDGSVVSVTFHAGGVAVGTDSEAPFSVNWQSATAGEFTITATAADDLGAVTVSAPVVIQVVENSPPVVTLTSPAGGSYYSAPATVEITAAAEDGDGSVQQVGFYAGATLLHTDTTAPFAFSWAGVEAGTYQITAVALDDNGASATTPAAGITVGVAPPAAPAALRAKSAKGEISLTWSDKSDNESGFRIVRSSDNSTFVEIGSVGANVTKYTDSEVLARNTTYYYRAFAWNEGGNSEASNTASVKTAR